MNAAITRQKWLIALILSAGLALRAYGYLRDPSVWHDEAALILNVIAKDFTELLGPLSLTQAAPPLFFWMERAAVLLLGDGTYALRLLPFLASCTTLVLFLWVARRLLPVAAVPWALLLFSFNDHLLWHAAEAKPYSFDVLAATVLLALWVRTQTWPLTRQLLLYTAVAPVMIFLSYPGCFLLGGLLLALLPKVWLQRRLESWLAYGGLAVSVGLAFVVLYLGQARTQHSAEMDSYWTIYFPPWGHGWWAIAVWAVKSTLEGLCYCCAPVGNVLVGVLSVGAIALWRRGQRLTVVLMLAPAALGLVAGLLGDYPYSGTRLLVYLTPAVVLLIAAGVPPTLGWLRPRSRLAAAVVVVLLFAAVGTVAYNTIFPYGRSDIALASRDVLNERRPGDVVWGNFWEQRYYFRHLGKAYISNEARPDLSAASRIWLVVIAKTSEERDEDLRAMAPSGWQRVQRRDYYRTTVLLIEPPSGRNAASVRPEETE